MRNAMRHDPAGPIAKNECETPGERNSMPLREGEGITLPMGTTRSLGFAFDHKSAFRRWTACVYLAFAALLLGPAKRVKVGTPPVQP